MTTAIGVAASLSAPDRARASGGGDYDDFEQSFFSPEIIDSPDEAPFFCSPHALYNHSGDDGAPPFAELEAANLGEWSRYFGGKVTEASLGYLVYKMKLAELDKLIWAFEGKSPQLAKEAASVRAQLDTVGSKPQVLKALYYLGFAKRCEPIASRRLAEDSWDEKKLAAASVHDADNAAKLLAGGESQLAKVDDPFLKERYRFQRIRLMFYTGHYTEAEDYYEANFASFTTESSVKYRFLETAAGSYYRDRKFGKANYLYSLLFDHFAPLKRSAYLSFRPVEDADWKDCLALAKSDRERAVIWQLLGIYADGPAAIEKIYAMAPNSDLLPLLAVREVNKAENGWFANQGRAADPVGSGAAEARTDADAVGKKRVALIKRIAEDKKALKPAVWQLSLAHLYALAGDTRSAEKYLGLAEKSQPQSTDISAQVRMTRLFARVTSLKAVARPLEPYLAAELTWLKGLGSDRGRALFGWTLGRLGTLYRAGGDPTRALLLVDDASADFYRDNSRIDAIAAFVARPGKSAFDQFLASNYSYKQGELVELKALNQLYAGRFKSAVDLFAQAGPEIANQPLRADPFLVHIVDCHDCDFDAKSAKPYTKASFAARMLELSLKAERINADAALASFKLATGLYNMSYYGNARDVYSTSHGNLENGGSLKTSMELAEKYYQRAMDLSVDKEFKAKACFMAAKTEQNRYFNAQADKPTSDGPEPVHSPVYFKLLKESYADTRYYQEVIRECGYFRKYLGR